MLCVIKCMCMRISQFPTDGNEEEKVRKGKGGVRRKQRERERIKRGRGGEEDKGQCWIKERDREMI